MQLIKTEKTKPPLWKAEQYLQLSKEASEKAKDFDERAAGMRDLERRMFSRAIAEFRAASRSAIREEERS